MKSNITQFALLLDDITKDVEDDSVLSARLRDFVQLASRLDILYRSERLMKEYASVVRKRLGLQYIRVVSAGELSDSQQQEIRQLCPETSDIEFVLDPSLKYGIQIMIDDMILDSSLTGRLQRLERSFQQQ